MLLGIPPHVDHLGQVDQDLGLLGLELVPAPAPVTVERFDQAVVGLLGGPQRQHLAALEAHVDPDHVVRHQSSTGSTSSVSTPPVDFGCTKATRLPLIPVRGSSSIRRSPAERADLSAESMSSVW